MCCKIFYMFTKSWHPCAEEVFVNRIAELFRYNALAALRNCISSNFESTGDQWPPASNTCDIVKENIQNNNSYLWTYDLYGPVCDAFDVMLLLVYELRPNNYRKVSGGTVLGVMKGLSHEKEMRCMRSIQEKSILRLDKSEALSFTGWMLPFS